MNHIVIFAAVILGACAQVPQQPWNGPYADHIPGQLVRDTPEVAAAKIQHNTAHSKVLSVLPVLPPEERYGKADINPVHQQFPQAHQIHTPQPQQYYNQHQAYNNHHQPQAYDTHRVLPNNNQNIPKHIDGDYQNNYQTPSNSHFDKFAEEIPRSSIGEVPEVAAARDAHLKAFAQVQATLPRLPESTTPGYIQRAHPIPQPYHQQPNYGYNQNANTETPEVARARLEHARAIAALGR